MPSWLVICPNVTNLKELTNELPYMDTCSQAHTSSAILGPKGGILGSQEPHA